MSEIKTNIFSNYSQTSISPFRIPHPEVAPSESELHLQENMKHWGDGGTEYRIAGWMLESKPNPSQEALLHLARDPPISAQFLV